MTMNKKMQKKAHFCGGLCVTLGVLLSLSGCVTAGKNTLPDRDGLSMEQIYAQTTEIPGASHPMTDRHVALKHLRHDVTSSRLTGLRHGVRQVSRSSFENVPFRQLPNPPVPLHVYAHLVQNSGGTQWVPAYTGGFFLYDKNHVALPSEQGAG